MKRKFLVTLLAAIAAVCCAFGLSACDDYETVDGLVLSYNSDINGYEIRWFEDDNATDLEIPDNYKGKPIKAIHDSAFYDCINLKSIIIPDSITTIGSSAFHNCSSLTSITIPDSVTSIGENAFSNCASLRYKEYDNAYYLGNDHNPYLILVEATNSSITRCAINKKTKIICNKAFYNCADITGITIPDNVTYIGSGAFENCRSLTSITIPDSVTSISDNAFCGCIGLASITIPNSITSIGNNAFRNCRNLKSITIPDSVTSIGGFAFSGCGILNIFIPNNVAFIGNGVFYNCANLTKISVADKNIVYHSTNNCLIETKSKTIISSCTNAIIPADGSVTSIGTYSIYGYIKFNGTIAQWNAISKSKDWYKHEANWRGRIYCTDGTIDTDGDVIE